MGTVSCFIFVADQISPIWKQLTRGAAELWLLEMHYLL